MSATESCTAARLRDARRRVRTRCHRVLLTAVTAAFVGVTAEAHAQTCRHESRIISDAVAEAVISARVLAIFKEASVRLLTAIVEGRLVRLGFEPSAQDREIAREHLDAIPRPQVAPPGQREIQWPQIDLVLRHPAKWLPDASAAKAAEEVCAAAMPRLPCEASDPRGALERDFARAFLADAGVCPAGAGPSPSFSRLDGNFLRYHDIFIAEGRFLKQYEFLANLRNAPFRNSALLNQIMYADFFQKALSQGGVSAFASEYLANSNPLSRLQLHRELRPIIGVLLDSRVLN